MFRDAIGLVAEQVLAILVTHVGGPETMAEYTSHVVNTRRRRTSTFPRGFPPRLAYIVPVYTAEAGLINGAKHEDSTLLCVKPGQAVIAF